MLYNIHMEEELYKLKEEIPKYNYYGDEVRKLFVIAGVIMAVTYPFFSALVGSSLLFSIIVCVAMLSLED
jgi:hypothetical protein